MYALNKSYCYLNTLYFGEGHTFTALLNDKRISKLLLLAIVETAYNLLFSDLPLTDTERSSLKRQKTFLRQLAKNRSAKSPSVRKRKLEILKNNRKATRIILSPLIIGSLKEICQPLSENIN